jgi:hypothetical protein
MDSVGVWRLSSADKRKQTAKRPNIRSLRRQQVCRAWDN